MKKEELILERNSKQMVLLDKDEISDERLLDIFSESPRETIYVKEDYKGKKKVIGIITLGNFRRNKLKGQSLLTTSFVKVHINAQGEAIRILTELKDKNKITAIPVVDDDGCLVKEYYKEISQNNELNLALIVRVYQETVLLKNYRQIIFVAGPNFSEKEFLHLMEYHSININPKIKIMESISLSDLINLSCQESVFICDFDEEAYRIREVFYQKYGFSHILCAANVSDISLKETINDKTKFYKKVGLWKISDYFLTDSIFASHEPVLLDTENCQWNTNESCYEYIGSIQEIPECIFMNVCFFEKPYICYCNTIIPIISIANINLSVSSVDIAINILPTLKRSQVKYIVFRNPDDEYDKVKDCFSTDIRGKGFYWSLRKENPEFIAGNDVVDMELIEELFQALSRYAAINGFIQQADVSGKHVNISNGERYTCDNPQNFKNTIFFFGPCLVQGNFVEDSYTLESYMRKYIDGTFYIKNCGDNWRDMNYKMRNQTYREGDAVVLFTDNAAFYEKLGIKLHSFIDVYRNIPNVKAHVWNSLLHVNKVAMKYIAKEMYEQCAQENLFANDCATGLSNREITFGIDNRKTEIPPQLESWLASAEKYKVEEAKSAGAIVMNCNPFTLGHRYLIEFASKKVEILYVFVVEENKSFFDFNDRLKMVKTGVADLDNVVVIPSGKYMISTETLPGYFEKETKPFVEFDATEDLVLFADVIAKRFNIQTRFAGEEPKDAFTNRYNESMHHILPKHGVSFCEIPRKKSGGDVISASLVRKYIREKNLEKVRNLVLPEIYDYLQQHHFFK